MRIGVVGATGLVGREMAGIVRERFDLSASSFLAFASGSSEGRTVPYGDAEVRVSAFTEEAVGPGDYLLGATTAEAAGEWVPRAVARGAVVIDNSSRYRMDPGVPLVVPEVNPGAVPAGCRLIANPNCSTIQLVVALAPLAAACDIEWAAVSTYQSVSGGGSPALAELDSEEKGFSGRSRGEMYHRNVLTSIGPLDGDLYCEEEAKLSRETARIIGGGFPVFPACARVPVRVGHLESVTIRFRERLEVAAVCGILSGAPGVVLHGQGLPPADVEGRDGVHVGRVRRSPSDGSVIQMWITADNVRKGAALNAVQILEMILGGRM